MMEGDISDLPEKAPKKDGSAAVAEAEPQLELLGGELR